jgi:hypothetical protein
MNYEADIAYLEHIDIAILSSINLWCRMNLYETEEYQKEFRLTVGIDFKNGKLVPNAHLTFLIVHETCHNQLTLDVSSLIWQGL